MSFSFAKLCIHQTSTILRRQPYNRYNIAFQYCKRLNSDKSDKSSELSSSTILMQDGLVMEELPVIVKKLKDVSILYDNRVMDEETVSPVSSDSKHYHLIQDEFRQCLNLRDVFSLLSKCGKITPNIALGAVERIYDLDEVGESWVTFNKPEMYQEYGTKSAIIDKLLNVVLRTEDAQTILNALRAVSSFREPYRDKFCEELLVKVTENKLSIEQLCSFIDFLSENKQNKMFKDSIDKLWIGFVDKEKEIDEKNIVWIFNILPHLTSSKRTILGLLEKRMYTVWWKLQSQMVQDILEVVSKENIFSPRTFTVLGRWMNTNIHSLSEDTLLEIITKFTQLNHNDGQIETALERYMKFKGIKIQTHSLVVSILNHCSLFRIRNNHILNGCSEYFIAKSSDIPPMFLKSIIYPYGYLHFYPQNGLNFWQAVENVLADKFSNLKVEDILDIMLSCVYLEKYPLNFVNKIFNPQFLHKVSSSKNCDRLRMKLKLLDTAMSLECKAYTGPLLPKDNWAKSTWYDGRIRRILNNIRDSLENVAGGQDCLSVTVFLPQLFTMELYVVDVMLHPRDLASSILNLNLKADRNVNVALLVHVPEHYCSNSDDLIGAQLLRIKHLRLLGMKVVSLNYNILSKLRLYRKELEKYIVDNLKNALPAL